MTIHHDPWKNGNMYDTGSILGTRPLRADGADLHYPCSWPCWTTSLIWDPDTTSSCTNTWQRTWHYKGISATVPM